MNMKHFFVGLALSGLAAVAAAQPVDHSAKEATASENPLKNAYFGETHVHTSFSLDAFIGGARLTPFDAYRYAKGEDVVLNDVIRLHASDGCAACRPGFYL